MTNFVRLLILAVICLINGRNCIANDELTMESACTKNDTCPKNSICDDQKHVCLCNVGYEKSLDSLMCQAQPKRVGDFCEEDDDCWNFQAFCTDKNVCNCLPPYLEDKDGHCAYTSTKIYPYIDRTCNVNSDCRKYRAFCAKDGVCFCGRPDRPSADNSTCQAALFLSNCYNDEDCATIPHAFCSPTLRECRCKPNFIEDYKNLTNCREAPKRVGDWCRDDVNCRDFGAICSKGQCKCDSNHITDFDNNCVKGIEINQTCTIDDDCLIYNAKCSKNKKCYCSDDGKSTTDGSACRAFHGMTCAENINCATMLNGHCEDGRCICNLDYILDETDRSACHKTDLFDGGKDEVC